MKNKVFTFNSLKDLDKRVLDFDATVLKGNKPFLLLKHWDNCGHCHEFSQKVFTPAFKNKVAKSMPIVEMEYAVHSHLQDAHPDHPLSLQMKGTPDVFPLLTVIVPGQGGYTGTHDFKGPRESKDVEDYVKGFVKAKPKKSPSKVKAKLSHKAKVSKK